MKDNFFIITAGKKNFICNRETGKWVLGNKVDENVLKHISKSFGKNIFLGTNMVVLNVSNSCNFDCVYCHVGSLKNDSKMSLEVGRKAIDRVLELDKTNRQVVFHGSEPMTNFELIKDLVLYAKRKRGDIKFSMQSNGSLFGVNELEFLSREGVNIGISLDGMEIHQNKTRHYIGGAPTYEKVMQNIHRIRRLQKGVSVISVVTKNNVNDLETIVNNFENNQINSVLFSPVTPSEETDGLCPNQEVLVKDMKRIFDRYIEKRMKKEKTIQIRNLKDLLRTFFIDKNTLNCAKCSGGSMHPLMAIDIDGSIYPCDYFWRRVEYRIGDIFNMSLKESFNSQNNFRVYRNIDSLKDCLICDWKTFCGSGCPGSSVRGGKGIVGKNHYCFYTKEMLLYVAEKISFLHENKLIGELIKN